MLQAADDHTVAVLLLAGLALTGNYIYWIRCLVLGIRNRVYPMPVACMLFFLVHDGLFVAKYDLWFNDIDHWFPKLWWFGLCLTFGMELAFLAVFLRFGRSELFPGLSQRWFVAGTVGAVGVALVPWLVVKDAMDDQLFLTIFGVTIFWCIPFNLALLHRRQSAVGQSVGAWAAYLLMPLGYWPATWILSDDFRSVEWTAFGVLIFLGGLVNMAYVHHLGTRVHPVGEGALQRPPSGEWALRAGEVRT